MTAPIDAYLLRRGYRRATPPSGLHHGAEEYMSRGVPPIMVLAFAPRPPLWEAWRYEVIGYIEGRREAWRLQAHHYVEASLRRHLPRVERMIAEMNDRIIDRVRR